MFIDSKTIKKGYKCYCLGFRHFIGKSEDGNEYLFQCDKCQKISRYQKEDSFIQKLFNLIKHDN